MRVCDCSACRIRKLLFSEGYPTSEPDHDWQYFGQQRDADNRFTEVVFTKAESGVEHAHRAFIPTHLMHLIEVRKDGVRDG